MQEVGERRERGKERGVAAGERVAAARKGGGGTAGPTVESRRAAPSGEGRARGRPAAGLPRKAGLPGLPIGTARERRFLGSHFRISVTFFSSRGLGGCYVPLSKLPLTH